MQKCSKFPFHSVFKILSNKTMLQAALFAIYIACYTLWVLFIIIIIIITYLKQKYLSLFFNTVYYMKHHHHDETVPHKNNTTSVLKVYKLYFEVKPDLSVI